jgi:hypothetical protein
MDWNYWQATVAFSAASRNGEVRQSRGVVLADIGAPVADFNLALLSCPAQDLDTALESAGAFFGAKQHPFRVSFRSQHVAACEAKLRSRGFTRVDDVPGMSLAAGSRSLPVRSDVVFRAVNDAKGLEDFRQTAFLGFGLPARAAHLFLTEELMAWPGFQALVGYRDGVPACTSALLESQGVAGIYWVATLEAQRRAGLGEAATWAAVAEGRRRGYDRACLQASAMGRPVYARMGFHHDRSYARFEAPAAAGPEAAPKTQKEKR